ncbi:response regulator [bacterium]|nr:response regulator [bacterium]
MKKILIVEDNDLNLRLVRMLLRYESYQFIEALNGEDAIDMASKEHPDLIVLDIQIPKIDGYQVAKKLKSDPVLKKIPIFALTAYAMKGDAEKILEAGCDRYMSKPLDTEVFKKIVKELMS